MADAQRPWYRELNRYHWFVLTVCTLGWLFDCLDQQLFNAERKPAMAELLALPANHPDVDRAAGLSTAILLIGWASGGILFGIMGDRIGRAKTMIFTILSYSIFTGLSALAVSVWDFTLYRFLTGLGVGGQFAVGVSLVAEALPDRARTPALGLLQALSAVGNVTAAVIVLAFERMAAVGVLPHSAWRWVFGVGILPALLAVVVMRKLKEPERWQKQVAGEPTQAKKAGSVVELFGTPRWRRNTIVGMLLASAGVIGLWGIGVFSNDLTHIIFSSKLEKTARDQGEGEKDRQFVRLVLQSPGELEKLKDRLNPGMLLGVEAGDKVTSRMFGEALQRLQQQQPISPQAIVSAMGSASPAEQRHQAYFLEAASLPAAEAQKQIAEHADHIQARQKDLNGQLGTWRAINLGTFNIGAFFGIYLFARVTQRIGRRPTFAIFFLLAMFSTAAAFLWMSEPWHLFVMVPLMGLFQLSVFGGYAIYFPELFPTRLRSTGVSFCYNIARFVAAAGPTALGFLTSNVYSGYPEPMRYAGVTMCAVFLVGVVVLPFAPETKDQPLPE